jgi:glutaredoxin 3
MSANVEIYIWTTCPFCVKAKKLLDGKGVKYTEYNLDGDEAGRDKMALRTGGSKSVPQIFIDGIHVGGCDAIHALDRAEKLDPMLAG